MFFCLGNSLRSLRARVSAVAAPPSTPVTETSSTPAQLSDERPERLSPLSALDHRDTAILKGLAIAAIVFHNFFHVVGAVRQNEFTFSSSRFSVFLITVVHPSLAIQAFFCVPRITRDSQGSW